MFVDRRRAASASSRCCARSRRRSRCWSSRAGCRACRRAADPGRAGASSSPSSRSDERGAAIGSWTAWGGIGDGDRPAGRRAARRHALVALGVRAQRAARRSSRSPDRARACPSARARATAAAPARLAAARCCARSASARISFALIEQPVLGWSGPLVLGPLAVGVLCSRRSSSTSARTPEPMLPLGLFRAAQLRGRRTSRRSRCTAGSAVTASSSCSSCSRWRASARSQAGVGDARPDAIVMFLLSQRVGRAGRSLRAALVHGRRAARWSPAGCLLMLRARRRRSTTSPTCCPAMLVFALGLAVTVAPLTATVLADADERDAGIASARQQRGRAHGRPPGDGRGRRRAGVGLDGARSTTSSPGRALAPRGPGPRGRARHALGRWAGGAPGRRWAEEVAQAGVATSPGRRDRRGDGRAAGTSAAVFLRNPRRRTSAECSRAGPVVGASEQVGGQPAPAQPAGARA